MKKDNLINSLELLKRDIAARPNDRSITTIISKHFETIRECIEYGFLRKDIYEIIFSDSDKEKIKFSHFTKVMLYRAKLKYKKNNNTQTIQAQNNDIINKGKEFQKQNKQQDPFAKFLSKSDKDEIHDSASNMQAANARIERLLKERGIKDD